MSCDIYRHGKLERGKMDMHYRPSAAQLERARAVIAFALHCLFPDRSALAAELAALVPAGRVFPPDDWFRDSAR